MVKEAAPAAPPDARLAPKNCKNWVLGSYLGKNFLILSLKAKLNACVGK